MNHDRVRPESLSRLPHTVIITGGNSGLGYACAQALLASSPPWHVVLACRDPLRAQSAVEALRRTVKTGAKVEAMVLDLASLASVRAFSAALNRRLESGELPPLHGIVCNAAIQGAKTVTIDGFEATFGVSHLGHFLLVNLLLASVKVPARIAVVASGVHDPAQLEGLPASASIPAPAWNTPAKLAIGELGPEAAQDDVAADCGRRYSTAKLANVYFTYGLATRLPEGVTVNAFDPGLMPGTGLAREYSAIGRFMWRFVMPRVLPLLRLIITKNIHTPAVSGASLARLITDPSLADTNGRYFEGLREIRSSAASYDKGRATELWEASVTLTSERRE